MRWLALIVAMATASGPVCAADLDPDAARLATELATLDADPALAGKAGLERFRARQAVSALQVARSRQHGQALLLAQARVETALETAQAELLLQQSAQLDRDRDQILLEASRREAELARRDADRLRMQALLREEQAERQAEQERLLAEQSAVDVDMANAQASQALQLAEARQRETQLARQEAELAAAVAADNLEDSAPAPPSRRSGNRTIYTLAGSAFASGSARLTGSAQASLRKLAAKLGPRATLTVEGHTDSQGADADNQALSRARAEAVGLVLQAAGVPAARATVTGKGETDPLVDNATPEGRARNRRVEISVQ